MAKQRSLLLFENSIKSKATLTEYMKNLRRFMDYCEVKDFDELIRINHQDLQIKIEDYIMDLKKKVSPNTIPSRFFPIQAFFEVNEIDLKWKKIRRLFPAKVKSSGTNPWTTSEIQKMLQFAPDLRSCAIIYFESSSGCRVGALPELQLCHLSEMPNGCKSVLVYPDSTEEYYTFLTPEASSSLDDYFKKRRKDGETLEPSSPVFRSNYRIGVEKVKPISERGITQTLQRIIKNANLRNSKDGKRYNTQLNHGFRKRFNTIMKLNKEINPNLVEKMMGHKKGLDGAYLRPTKEELFDEFKKAIPDLTINDSHRIKEEKKKIEIERSELEEQKLQIKDQSERIAKLEQTLFIERNFEREE